ncbi:LysM peptidoglycan-binding domain-containing protein [bacterium]|nr:LysM peptidoglycan-binding domain-containing protein [bacterium]
MTRETKFGLLFVFVLTGVFGMLVYKRLHQPADLVAGTEKETETADNDGGPGDAGDGTSSPTAVASTDADPTFGDDPFASPPSKPVSPTKPDVRKPSGAPTPTVADFGADLTPAALPTIQTTPKLPTEIPDDDFFSAPAPNTTTARSTPVTPPTDEVDPFGTATAATSPSQPDVPDFANPSEVAGTNSPASTPTDSSFDPFADPAPTTANPTSPSEMAAKASEADPFADGPAIDNGPTETTTTMAATPVASSPAADFPGDDDPFMAPTTAQPTPTDVAQSDPPAFDEFDTPAKPAVKESAPAPELEFDETPIAVTPAKPVIATPAAMPATPVDDPFAVDETPVTARTATPVPTDLGETEITSQPTRPALPTELDEFPVASPPPAKPVAEMPDLDPPKVASAIPEMTLPANDPLGNPPKLIDEPDPFGFPENETPLPTTKPVAIPKPVATPMPATPRLAVNTGTYEVQHTDSFWTISKQVYGTGRYFQALAKHNATVANDPQKLKPGSIIETPPAEVLETRYRAEIPLANAADTASTAVGEEDDAGFFVDDTGRAMYRVGSNDTLSSISKAHLGRASRWIQIFEMNRTILKDGNTLKVGAVLQLPADASQVQMVDFQQPGR